ncbi:MAG: transcriptional repressor [Phycisphaerales bacterium]|nr:transcriptional repressor [Phycisphaerales bacterium]
MPHSASSPAARTDVELKAQLRAAGLRVTGIRLSIMRALRASRTALDATALDEQLAAAGEHADRVTVYRTLNTLVDSGIAHRIDPGDRIFRYSLTDHAHCTEGHHEHEHPHMVCDACGAVECIEDAEVVIKPRAKAETTPRSPRKFRITQQSVLLHGMCERCGET